MALPKTGNETITSRSYEYDAHAQVTKATEGNTKSGTQYSYTYDASVNITEQRFLYL